MQSQFQFQEKKEQFLEQWRRMKYMASVFINVCQQQHKKFLEYLENQRYQILLKIQEEEAKIQQNQNPQQDRISSPKNKKPKFQSPLLYQVPSEAQNNQQKVQKTEYKRQPQSQFEQVQFQSKAKTKKICSACDQVQEKNHQCQGEYGFVLCPYCGEMIVRSFMIDHQEDCIPFIEYQFTKFGKSEECSICCETITENKIKLKCNHSFHKDCIFTWKHQKNECPNCRQYIKY